MYSKGLWYVSDGVNVMAPTRRGGRVVAQCGGFSHDEASDEENKANALLCSAAPTLLDTVEELVASMEEVGTLSPDAILALIQAKRLLANIKKSMP